MIHRASIVNEIKKLHKWFMFHFTGTRDTEKFHFSVAHDRDCYQKSVGLHCIKFDIIWWCENWMILDTNKLYRAVHWTSRKPVIWTESLCKLSNASYDQSPIKRSQQTIPSLTLSLFDILSFLLNSVAIVHKVNIF
jgi:hypothetical protein